MGIEGLGQCPRFLLLHSLNLFKERNEGGWIVSSAIHVFDAEIVRLGLEPAGELQKSHGNGESSGFVAGVANGAAHKDEGDRSHLQQVGASHFAAVVAGGGGGGFVRPYGPPF